MVLLSVRPAPPSTWPLTQFCKLLMFINPPIQYTVKIIHHETVCSETGTEKKVNSNRCKRIEKYEENMRKCVFYPISEGNRKTKLWWILSVFKARFLLSPLLLIDINGFSILPCNEFSIKPVNGHRTPSLLLLNPIPQTASALSIMDSLFHRLWLVFLWCSVNISAHCLSFQHSPLCYIDLFVLPSTYHLCGGKTIYYGI